MEQLQAYLSADGTYQHNSGEVYRLEDAEKCPVIGHLAVGSIVEKENTTDNEGELSDLELLMAVMARGQEELNKGLQSKEGATLPKTKQSSKTESLGLKVEKQPTDPFEPTEKVASTSHLVEPDINTHPVINHRSDKVIEKAESSPAETATTASKPIEEASKLIGYINSPAEYGLYTRQIVSDTTSKQIVPNSAQNVAVGLTPPDYQDNFRPVQDDSEFAKPSPKQDVLLDLAESTPIDPLITIIDDAVNREDQMSQPSSLAELPTFAVAADDLYLDHITAGDEKSHVGPEVAAELVLTAGTNQPVALFDTEGWRYIEPITLNDQEASDPTKEMSAEDHQTGIYTADSSLTTTDLRPDSSLSNTHKRQSLADLLAPDVETGLDAIIGTEALDNSNQIEIIKVVEPALDKIIRAMNELEAAQPQKAVEIYNQIDQILTDREQQSEYAGDTTQIATREIKLLVEDLANDTSIDLSSQDVAALAYLLLNKPNWHHRTSNEELDVLDDFAAEADDYDLGTHEFKKLIYTISAQIRSASQYIQRFGQTILNILTLKPPEFSAAA